MREIIDLRMSKEELEELPMYQWQEFLVERRKQVKQALKMYQDASEFLELATAEDLRERALGYKRVVKRRMKKDKEILHWTREKNLPEEGRKKERLTNSEDEKREAEEKKKKKRIEKDVRPPSV